MVAGFSNSMLRAGRRWLAPAAMVIACAGLPVGVLAQAARPLPVQDLISPAESSLQVIRNPASTPLELSVAARALIASCDQGPVRQHLQELIAGPASPSWQAVLSAISTLADAPPRLFPSVAARIAEAPPSEAVPLIAALGSYRTRESVRVIGHYLRDTVDEPVRGAAMAALARLSSVDELNSDLGACRRFVAEADSLSESQWRVRLIEAVTAKERRTEALRQEAVSQLVAALRKLHLATPAEGRPTLLANLLLNETPDVRSLGFELVGRELSVSGRIDGPVGDAALQLLQSSDARVRSSAAVVVRQLAPDGASVAIADALAKETDPQAAADLLLAAARWPSPAIVEPVIRWITQAGPTTDAATEAAWWLLRAGELHGNAADTVLEAVRRPPLAGQSPSAISLLAGLGNDEDRAGLVPLLRSESGNIRQAVGESLLWDPEFTADILDAAASDPDLFDIACRAVLVSKPTELGVRRLLTLPRPAADVAVPALLRTANGLTAPELLEVARAVGEVTLRRGLLELLVAPDRVMSERADMLRLHAICEGVVELADLELSERQPEAALAVLENGAAFEMGLHAHRLTELRATALLALGHLELAANLQAPCGAWLRGLEMVKDGEAASTIVQAMEARFGSSMTDEEEAAFVRLKKDIATAEEARGAAQRPRDAG
jgi:hypothetical protein